MPRIIDYPVVVEHMTREGFVSLYHNSGAFGFDATEAVQTIGWVGSDDPTIRETAQSLVRRVAEPYEQTLSQMLERVWIAVGGSVWLMPKSHWHYELHFGNRELLEPVLKDCGIDPSSLAKRNDGSAIEFLESERDLFREAAKRLLDGLRGSDFMLAFPGQSALCTIHHHKQLWWQTTNAMVVSKLQ
jgi:hypothetical protein